MLELDHIVVSAATLAEGSAAVEAALGVGLSPGGEHALMGTHNRLLSLGPGTYLEVIAIDPSAPMPGRARWFDLDRFAGGPRLTNWVARCADLDAELAASPPGAGRAHDLRRGDFRWRMGIPDDGCLPFGGAFPGLIAWQGGLHPPDRLPDARCRLERLTIRHPQAPALRAALEGRIADGRLALDEGPSLAFEARIETPHGMRILT